MRISSFSPAILLAITLAIPAAREARAQEPLKVAPEMYRLLQENDRIRVLEVTFKPGAKIAKHSHPDHMVYAITAGKLRISHPTGEPADVEVKAGDVLWIPAETHWAENTGKTELRLLVTELKEPAPAKTTTTPVTK
jgi:quercetin dioxygenase-like cupin family protein